MTSLKSLTGTLRAIGWHTMRLALKQPYRKAWAEATWDFTHRRYGAKRWLEYFRRLRLGRKPWPRVWQTPGAVRQLLLHPLGANLVTECAALDITFLAPDFVRLTWIQDDPEPAFPIPYAIAKPEEAWEGAAVSFEEREHEIVIASEQLQVHVSRADGSVTLTDAAGRLVRPRAQFAWAEEGAVRETLDLLPQTRFFGLGERATPWNRRGRTHILWNTDPAGYGPGDDPINLNIPVYVSVDPEAPWATHLAFYENSWYAEFDLGAVQADHAELRFAGGMLRSYIALGDVPHVLERYTELTGRHALPPLWLLGYQQSRWSYYPEARVRKLAEDFREHQVPCDAIHLDIHYMDGYRVFTWDRERFPDLPGLAAELRAMGIKLVAIIDPGIKQDPAYPVYQSGLAGGHFCTLPDGKPVIAPVWPGECAFPDFTSPAARAWWGEQYRPLLAAGIAGFWNDMNEPGVFASSGDRTLPEVTRHALEGRGGDHREAHNLYGMQMARASQEGLLKLTPERRPVVITRAGWAGVQRYATSWTADNQSTWASYRLTIPVVLGLGLSGLAFTGPDTGGFIGECDGELFTRWVQMSAFMPFFRAHTEINAPDQEPWSYGEPYLTIVRRFIELRYELLPYLYTAVWQMHRWGWPMVRPLAWGSTAPGDLWDVDDAFLCGDALLVAPILEAGAQEREVRLPPGAWYDFWSNAIVRGAKAHAFAPLELTPLYVRAGSVLPLGESGMSVEHRMQKFIRLHVYPSLEDGENSSWLYEDEGEGLAYRAGVYRLSRLRLTRQGQQLILDWEKLEGDYTPPYEHVELVLNGLVRVPRRIEADVAAFAIAESDPVRRTVRLGVPLFQRLIVDL